MATCSTSADTEEVLTERPHMDVGFEAPIGMKFGKRGLTIRNLRELGWYVSQEVLRRFVSVFPQPRTDLAFHDFPAPEPWPGQPLVVGRPGDTKRRFAGWKVWLEPGELRMPTPASLPEMGSPAWNLQSPTGLVLEIPALGLALAEFRQRLTAIVGADTANEIAVFFEPIERDSPAGWGVFPR